MIGLVAFAVMSPTLSGTFFQGDGMGSNHTMHFSPDGRVTYVFDGCFSGYKLSGKFAFQGSRITLNVPGLRESQGFPSEYNLIRWGQTVFLLGDDEVPHFLYKLRSGWRGESDKWGLSNFLRNDLDRRKESPTDNLSGVPDIPDAWKAELKRTSGYTVIHCSQDQEGPLNCGREQLIAEGVLLADKSRKTLAWVESTERESAWIRRLIFGKLKAGLKMEASIPPAFWRRLVQDERTSLNQAGEQNFGGYRRGLPDRLGAE